MPFKQRVKALLQFTPIAQCARRTRTSLNVKRAERVPTPNTWPLGTAGANRAALRPLRVARCAILEVPMGRISHVSVGVNDVPRAKAFYDPLMTLIGLRIRQADDDSVDYGNEGLVFSLETPTNGQPATPGNGVHIAFAVPDRATVDAFHSKALQLGARDAGPPGLRPQYSDNYYGAFVLDLDGNKIEAVTGI